MPEPIQSVWRNITEHDPSQDVCSEPPAAEIFAPQAANSSEPAVPSASSSAPAVTLLVSRHPPAGVAARPVAQCLSEEAALLTAGSVLLRSTGALVVTAPTILGEIPAITAFIGSAIAVGVTAAMYLNCRDAKQEDAKLGVGVRP